MARPRGLDNHLKRLARLQSPAGLRKLSQALFYCGNLVQTEAQRLITEGAVSGKFHVPSLPYHAPNQDTGFLGNNIETVALEPFLVEVSSNAPYAARLELGDSKIIERPYMRPARDSTRPEIRRTMLKAMERVVKGSGRR